MKPRKAHPTSIRGALKQYDSSLTKFLNETLHNNTVGGTTGGGGILKEGDLTSPNAVKGTSTTNINQGDPDRPVNIGSEYNGGGTAIGGGGTANLKQFDSSSPKILNETQHDNTIGGTTGGGGDFKLPPGPSQQIYNTSNTPTGGVADRESSVPSVLEIVITKDQDQSSTNILGEAAKGTSNFNPGRSQTV